MRSRVKYMSLFLVLGVLAVFQVGCSKSSTLSGAPSDEEAITAIKTSIQTSPITAMSPIQIVEKGKRKQNGAWPFKIKFTASTFIDYAKRKEFLKEATYDISQSQDKTGKSIWVAEEEK